MKSMRSSFALLLSTFGAMVLVANCTVKEGSSDGAGGDPDTGCVKGKKRTGCACPGNIEGSQTCGSDGTYGACDCPGTNTGGTSANNNGGDTSTTGGTKGYAGTSTTGGTGNGTGGDETVPADGGAGGAAGAGPVVDPTANCEDCLAALCPTQWDACLADPDCVDDDGSGQYADIMIGCIEPERANGVVTRDKVRGCGFTMGVSSDPNTIDVWAPEPMAQSTADLMNCMAMGKAMPDASWANDPDNFPNGMPKPWPAGTCAKLSCASAK
jgi:hypothetical protein